MSANLHVAQLIAQSMSLFNNQIHRILYTVLPDSHKTATNLTGPGSLALLLQMLHKGCLEKFMIVLCSKPAFVQANYSAANAALDAASAGLAARGQAAISIQWGAWAGAGMASQSARKMQSLGLGAVTPALGLLTLSRILHGTARPLVSHNPGSIIATPFDWPRFTSSMGNPPALFAEHLHAASDARLTERPSMKPAAAVSITAPTRRMGIRAPPGTHRAMAPRQARAPSTIGMAEVGDAPTQSLEAIVGQVLAAAEAVAGQAVGQEEPLMAAGVDSLGAVELRNTLQRALAQDLPSTLVLDYPTALAIATHIQSIQPAAPVKAAAELSVTNMEATYSLTTMDTVAVGGHPMGTHLVAVHGFVTRLPGQAQATQAGMSGMDTIQRIPPSRWDSDVALTADPPSRFGSFLADPFDFDPSAVGISLPEALLMDPQQRILLEAIAELAMGASGESGLQLGWKEVGVFVGISTPDYADVAKAHSAISPYTATGSALSAAAGRLSYSLGFQGPAISGEPM